MRGMERRKVFFSEEKKQKTFANSDPGAACGVRDSVVKVFWFFSSEKNAIHFRPLAIRAQPPYPAPP
jgi:hypothetical protein